MAMVHIRISALEVSELLGLRGDALSALYLRPGGLERYQAAEAVFDRAGEVDGRHYSQHTKKVRALEKSGDLAGTESLLLRLISALEHEGSFGRYGWYPPPWYYERLAMVYRKMKKPDAEIGALQSYVDLNCRNATTPDSKLSERLSRVIAKRQT